MKQRIKSAIWNIKKQKITSGQDGSIGRYTVPPCSTKRRTTTNLKTKNNQNCQNNQGVKEETFIQTGRRGGDRQPGHRGLPARWQLEDKGGGGWRSGWFHFCMQINQEEQLESETDHAT